MYKIGDSVVYGQSGVMTVVDIKEEKVLGKVREYYVLRAPRAARDSLTYVPCDSAELTGQMSPVISEEELREIFIRLSRTDDIEWQEENRQRAVGFRRILDSGDRLEILKMIRAVRRRTKGAEGKKGNVADENIIKKAEYRIISEICAALDVDYTEAERYLTDNL